MAKSSVTREQVFEAHELYLSEKHLSLGDLSKKYGLSRTAISYHFEKFGLPVRARGGAHPLGKSTKRYCLVCGKEIVLLESVVRARKTVKYCSRKCMGEAQRKPGRFAKVACNYCHSEFFKRADHLRERNYCSGTCFRNAKRRAVIIKWPSGGKWKDPEYIRTYMRGYYETHKGEMHAKSAEWFSCNHEKKLEIQARYRETHRDRIQVHSVLRRSVEVDGDLTAEQWSEIKRQHDYTCAHCGKSEPEIKLTLDHIVPVSKGGKHTASNVQPLCKSCNSRKGNKLPGVGYGDLKKTELLSDQQCLQKSHELRIVEAR